MASIVTPLRQPRHVPSMFGTIGIIGLGAFGAFMREQAEEHMGFTRILAWDSDETRGSNCDLEEAAACDIVILAVPISQFEKAVHRVIPLMKRGGILVDVCTVKVHTVEILKCLGSGIQWIATHPMFGPESYRKRNGDISGFRILLAEHTLEYGVYKLVKDWLRDFGLRIVEMTAEEHDQHTARTLFLTHYIGQIVATAGFDRTEIDTVSFGFLMDAVDSVRHDKELFTQVYRLNAYCQQVLDMFARAKGEVDTLLSLAVVV